MEDAVLKGINDDKTIKVVAARTTNLVQEASRRHRTSPLASAALGRVLTGALLLGLDLKGRESVTVRINGGGPAGTILAVAEGDGTVRGYITEPDVDLPEKSPGKLDVGSAVGTDGLLEVVRDLGLKSPFIGAVHLISGEIAEDIAYYLSYSEQVSSLVSLGVLVDRDRSVKAAGGILVQALPGADEALLEKIEQNIERLGPISSLIDSGTPLEHILRDIYGDIPFTIIEERKVAFQCKCSREKVEAVLKMLEPEDIEKALETQGRVEIRCNFCNETYYYTEQEVMDIRNRQLSSES